MLIISFQFPLQLVVQAVEKVEITFYSKIFSIYNLIGDILIIRILGIVGVALVTCSARLFQFIFVLHYIKKHVPLKLNIGALTKIAMNTLVMTVVLYLLNPFVTNISTLILIVIFGTIIYFGLSFFNKSFFDEERAIINKLLPRPLFVF
jgi:O-antigen/teichoic acid export membrane protein